MTKQLTIEYAPGTPLSITWKRRDLAEQSAEGWRRRGIEVEVVPQDQGFVVMGAS